jgi:hypothetical protein
MLNGVQVQSIFIKRMDLSYAEKLKMALIKIYI